MATLCSIDTSPYLNRLFLETNSDQKHCKCINVSSLNSVPQLRDLVLLNDLQVSTGHYDMGLLPHIHQKDLIQWYKHVCRCAKMARSKTVLCGVLNCQDKQDSKPFCTMKLQHRDFMCFSLLIYKVGIIPYSTRVLGGLSLHLKVSVLLHLM